MTIEQYEERNTAIIHNALLWAKNQDCDTLYLLDVAVVAEYLFLNLPHCFYNFISTDKPGQVRASSAHKTIMKTLDKIHKILLDKEAHIYDIL